MTILQLVKKPIIRPYEIAKYILVKVDKFLIPVDFVVMDTEDVRLLGKKCLLYTPINSGHIIPFFKHYIHKKSRRERESNI